MPCVYAQGSTSGWSLMVALWSRGMMAQSNRSTWRIGMLAWRRSPSLEAADACGGGMSDKALPGRADPAYRPLRSRIRASHEAREDLAASAHCLPRTHQRLPYFLAPPIKGWERLDAPPDRFLRTLLSRFPARSPTFSECMQESPPPHSSLVRLPFLEC